MRPARIILAFDFGLRRIGLASGDTLTRTAAPRATVAHHAGGLLDEARHYCKTVLPNMLKVREYADKLEGYVADDLWPLPTYQEMLFIK